MSQLPTELDGRGEGFGKYQGLTIGEIVELFDRCVSDPSMRSISAVLRITREQLEARGRLGTYPVFAWIAGVLCGASLLGLVALPPIYQEWAKKGAIGTGCVFFLLLISAVPTHGARKRNLKQEEAIRDAATQALNQILQTKPALKALTFEQEQTVKDLLKKAKNGDRLRELL